MPPAKVLKYATYKGEARQSQHTKVVYGQRCSQALRWLLQLWLAYGLAAPWGDAMPLSCRHSALAIFRHRSSAAANPHEWQQMVGSAAQQARAV